MRVKSIAGSKGILFHVLPGKSIKGIWIMYILNGLTAISMKIYMGIWLVPDLDLMDLLAVSVLVRGI